MSSILKLEKSNCRNCYKCIRNCPVKAISVENEQAVIIEHDCILCGKCVLTCPQNAKYIRSDVDTVRKLLNDKKVIASVAPSFISEYGISFEIMRETLKQIGFFDAEETAIGAYIVKTEYEKLLVENTQGTYISSCCPTVVSLISKHYPALIKNLAPVISPMQAHATLIKEEHPDASIVFIGPCYSKKAEVEKYGGLDAALTFEELNHLLDEANVEIVADEIAPDDKMRSRSFPISGGIIKSMDTTPDHRYIAVDGIEDCINIIKEIENGNIFNCFIEMSACRFGCVNGPATHKHNESAISASIKVSNYSNTDRDFDAEYDFSTEKNMVSEYVNVVKPGAKQIEEILRKMGKAKPEDELNCGTCGYSTCREKAIAVYYNKANINMCLPFMREKAESLSDKIISETPNAILTVDTNFNVAQINKMACKMFNISNADDVIKSSVSTIMDPENFEIMFDTGRKTLKSTVYLPEYNKYCEQILVYDMASGIVICIMKDVTDNIIKSEEAKKVKENAVRLADDVLDNQMRVVQEIASLLGETTAQTQIALSKLKETITLEES